MRRRATSPRRHVHAHHTVLSHDCIFLAHSHIPLFSPPAHTEHSPHSSPKSPRRPRPPRRRLSARQVFHPALHRPLIETVADDPGRSSLVSTLTGCLFLPVCLSYQLTLALHQFGVQRASPYGPIHSRKTYPAAVRYVEPPYALPSPSPLRPRSTPSRPATSDTFHHASALSARQFRYYISANSYHELAFRFAIHIRPASPNSTDIQSSSPQSISHFPKYIRLAS